MRFLIKILLLLSLGFNLGASTLEPCGSDIEGDSGENFHEGKRIKLAFVYSSSAAEHDDDADPFEHICHNGVCHFGHCAHVQLQNFVILEPETPPLRSESHSRCDDALSFDFKPYRDRPPTRA